MVLADGFSGILGEGIAVTITPPGGSATAIPLHEILEWTPMKRDYFTTTTKIQSGTLAGKEIVTVGTEKASPASVKVVYERLHRAAFNGVSGINGCSIVFSWPDGNNESGIGCLVTIDPGTQSDTKVIEDTLNFMLNAGWTPTGSGSGST